MNKPALRKRYLAKRLKLSQKDFQQRNELIKLHFFDFFHDEQLTAVHTFLPIKKQNEVDITAIINELRMRKPECKIIISKSNFTSLDMKSFLFRPETHLKENKWGIAEPVEAELFKEEAIDMVLVPLLVFDLHGHRVGYGKGFYDRFLKKCRPDTLKVGLSFEPPVTKISDVNIHDVQLDYCVTPQQVYHF